MFRLSATLLANRSCFAWWWDWFGLCNLDSLLHFALLCPSNTIFYNFMGISLGKLHRIIFLILWVNPFLDVFLVLSLHLVKEMCHFSY